MNLQNVGSMPAGWVTVSGGRLPYPVDVWFARDAQGRLMLTGLKLEGHRQEPPYEVTATLVREVSAAIGDLLRYVAEYRMDDESVAQVVGAALNEAAAPYGGVALRPGRKGHSREFYREVAEAFVQATREDPARPLSLLARRLYRSESQTRRLVKRARELYPELFEEPTGGKP